MPLFMATFQLCSRARSLLGERVGTCKSVERCFSACRKASTVFPATPRSESASRFVMLRMVSNLVFQTRLRNRQILIFVKSSFSCSKREMSLEWTELHFSLQEMALLKSEGTRPMVINLMILNTTHVS